MKHGERGTSQVEPAEVIKLTAASLPDQDINTSTGSESEMILFSYFSRVTRNADV
jgi:hypothetical protein